ncbi:hypothetical protein ACP70R_029418 [Stipagrostis hirtigluma subsp. patula]
MAPLNPPRCRRARRSVSPPFPCPSATPMPRQTHRRRADAVGWLRALFPDLPAQASDDDLHAALASGRLLCALLRRLCPGALLDDASTDNVGRFRAAVARMGVPTFSAYDLETGQMTAVITCILALKDRFASRIAEDQSSTFMARCDSEGSRRHMEAKLQRVLTSPVMSEPSSPLLGADLYSPSRVFQLKQGYSDPPGCRISDLMKSTSLENAPTQSLLGVVNSILDESIERKNGQIPYRIACFLRKVIVEIERRISTQAGHIRNQNNLIKSREEKYQSRIRVLEALAAGASRQTHVEKDKPEDRGQLAEEDMDRLMKYEEDLLRLMKEKEDMVRLLKEKDDMVRLLKEKEEMVRFLKEKEDMVDLDQNRVEDTQRIVDENKDRLLKNKDDTIVRLTREKEDVVRLLKEKEYVIRLMKEKEDMVGLKNVTVDDTQRTIDQNKDRLLKEKDDIVVRLTKEKEDMVRLLKEKEDMIRLMKEKDMVGLKNVTVEDTQRTIDENKDRLVKEKDDIVVRLTKEKDGIIVRLTKEKEDMVRLLKEKEDLIRVMKEKEDMINLERGKIDDRKVNIDDDRDRLIKENNDILVRLTREKEEVTNLLKEKEDVIRLMKEEEDMFLSMKEGEDKSDLNKGINAESRKQSTAEGADMSIKEKGDIIRLMKEDYSNSIMKLKQEIESLRSSNDESSKLMKEKEDYSNSIMKLKQEIESLRSSNEESSKLMKEKEDYSNSIMKLKQEIESLRSSNVERSKLMKEKEDYSNSIMKLKQEIESLRSSNEESSKLLETKKEDIGKLLTDKEANKNIILQLRQQLEATKKLHETQTQQLETKAAQVNKELEQKIKEVELMLENSTKRRRELEQLSESRIQFWKQKEVVVKQFVSLQIKNSQDLRLSSVSVRDEILNCQKRWFEELAGLGQNLKVVTNAAEKYHSALAENRKLFNEIQELKGNIRVYCRIRPFRPWEDEKSTSVEYIGDNGEMILSNPTKKGKEGGKNFTFNKVFGPKTTQDMVFKDIQPLIRSVLDGYNVCIFAYGQTGSGKTYTMMGPENATENEWGVNYRALNDLFNISHDRRDTIKYELGVQMVEIYNEQIRDLLGSGGSQKKYPSYSRLCFHYTKVPNCARNDGIRWPISTMMEFNPLLFSDITDVKKPLLFLNLHTLGIQNTTQPNGLAVPDATMCPVHSTSHVIELMQTGHNNRSMSATALNERSSRSHSVVTIHVQGQDLKTGNNLRGALHLVDLAGSERVDRSAVTGDRLKEAQHINKSLAALGDVIFSLSQKNAHVPYRNSKLTQVLQTALGGHAKTLMFVQVNPDVSSYTETLSTLKFAERVSGVELGVARTNKEGKDVKELMDQLSLLKDTISKKDEEIDRLQLLNTSTSRFKSMKHSSSSPGMTSLGKAASVGSGAASDLDNFSDTSDRPSEAGSMLSTDDTRQLGQSSADPEISAPGDIDSDGRLSDVSDGGILGGAETDSSVNNMVDQEQEKRSSAAKERLTKAVNRVQKLTVPKVGQASSLRAKPRDPSAPKPSVRPQVHEEVLALKQLPQQELVALQNEDHRSSV